MQTTYIQQLQRRLGDQIERMPGVAPSVQSYAHRVSTLLTECHSAATTDIGTEHTVPSSADGRGCSNDSLRQALWEMHLFDRWLPGETSESGIGLGEDRFGLEASLSYGILGDVEALVQQRQNVQLSQLSLYLRDESWRALLPALTRLIQPRDSDRSSRDDEFVTLYRLLYGLTCANGRRGVTITR